MINKLEYNKCTICQSCINACPKKCIKLDKLKEEFIYPIIDNTKCIRCGICEKVCPVLSPLEIDKPLKEIYAAKSLNEKIRLDSSSGGIFSCLSEEIIENKGVVCGVALDNEFRAKHIIVDNKNNLSSLRGSKYVQSDIDNTFNLIKKELLNYKEVLFSGCPCQVAGLKKFLGKEYNNLYTVDFICHGIPSQKIYSEYIKILQNKYNSKVVKFLFREKSKGWHTSSVKVTFENGRYYTKPITEDMYMRGFLSSIYIKPACYNCDFREFKSGSDITLADFWGAEVEEKEIDDNKGISLMIINSQKGKLLLNRIESKVFIKPTDFDNAVKYNLSLFKSSKPSVYRNDFFKVADIRGYDKAFKIYCKEKKIIKCKKVIRRILGKIKRTMI